MGSRQIEIVYHLVLQTVARYMAPGILLDDCSFLEQNGATEAFVVEALAAEALESVIDPLAACAQNETL